MTIAAGKPWNPYYASRATKGQLVWDLLHLHRLLTSSPLTNLSSMSWLLILQRIALVTCAHARQMAALASRDPSSPPSGLRFIPVSCSHVQSSKIREVADTDPKMVSCEQGPITSYFEIPRPPIAISTSRTVRWPLYVRMGTSWSTKKPVDHQRARMIQRCAQYNCN